MWQLYYCVIADCSCLLFACQLPGKNSSQKYVLCVEWDSKHYMSSLVLQLSCVNYYLYVIPLYLPWMFSALTSCCVMLACNLLYTCTLFEINSMKKWDMAVILQDRVIFHRLENICHCIERGEWPGGHRYGGSLLSAMDSHSSTPVPGTPTSTPLPMECANSAASALERLVSITCINVFSDICIPTHRLSCCREDFTFPISWPHSAMYMDLLQTCVYITLCSSHNIASGYWLWLTASFCYLNSSNWILTTDSSI